MALSNFGGGRYQIDVDAAVQSQDINGNYSVIYARIIVRRISGSGYRTSNPQAWSFYVNGTHIASGSWTYNFGNYATHDHWIWQGTWTHYHNADGSATPQNFTGSANMDSGMGTGSAGGTITPATIPRASTPSLSTNPITAGSAVTINTNRVSSNFSHELYYSFGNTGLVLIAGNISNSQSWTPPLSLLQQIPNAASGNGTLRLYTYNGGNSVGFKDIGFTLNAPASAVPTFNSATVADVATTSISGSPQDISTLIGAYVQSKSLLKVDVSASGYQGSTIRSRRFTLDGLTAESGATLPPSQGGTRTISYTVTDSRGRTASSSQTINVLPYALPTTTAFSVRRAATSGGVVNDEGTYLRVDMTAAVQSLIVGGTQKNSLQIRAFTKPRGGTLWTARNVINHSALTYNSYFVISGGSIFPVDESFDVRVEVIDRLDRSTNLEIVPTAEVYMHWGSQGIALGKFYQKGSLDVAGAIYTKDIEVATAPIYGMLDPAYRKGGRAKVQVSNSTDPENPSYLWNTPAALSTEAYDWSVPYDPQRGREVSLVKRGTGYVITGQTERGEYDLVPYLNTDWFAYAHLHENAFATPKVSVLPSGLVIFSGLIKFQGGTPTNDSVIFTLPPGVPRPEEDVIHYANVADTSRAVTIGADGSVRVRQNSWPANQYLSLENISYWTPGVPQWTPITSWSSYAERNTGWDATYGIPSYWKDPWGFVWFKSLVRIKVGVAGDNTPLFSLPSTHVPTDGNHAHMRTTCIDSLGVLGTMNSNDVVWKSGSVSGAPNSWLSLGGVSYPAAEAVANPNWVKIRGYVNGAGDYGGSWPVGRYLLREDGLRMTAGLLNSGTYGASPRHWNLYQREMWPSDGQRIFETVGGQARSRFDIYDGDNPTTARGSVGHINTAGPNPSWMSLDSIKWVT